MAGANAFSLGKDVTLNITVPGSSLPLPVTVTAFEARPQTVKIRRTGMDAVNRGANVPNGWEGSIELDRHDSTIDDFFAAAEAGFYAGQNSYTAQIMETISEIDGSTSQYRYTGVCLNLDEAGKKQGDKEINMVIGFFASKRIKVQ